MAGVTDSGRERGQGPLVPQNSEVNLGVDLPWHSFVEGQKVVLCASLAASNESKVIKIRADAYASCIFRVH